MNFSKQIVEFYKNWNKTLIVNLGRSLAKEEQMYS